jgi:glutamine synthetase
VVEETPTAAALTASVVEGMEEALEVATTTTSDIYAQQQQQQLQTKVPNL